MRSKKSRKGLKMVKDVVKREDKPHGFVNKRGRSRETHPEEERSVCKVEKQQSGEGCGRK